MSARRSSLLLSALALASVLSGGAVADAALSKEGASSVTFHAIGPAGMSIDGTTSDLSTKDDGTQVRVVIPLANLATGMSLRDRHMKDKYLEVGTYPTAELVVARSDLHFPADGASASGDAPAKLSLHGVTRDVKVHYSADNKSGVYAVKGKFSIDMNDYKIEVPSYLGVSVKPQVDVVASFNASDR